MAHARKIGFMLGSLSGDADGNDAVLCTQYHFRTLLFRSLQFLAYHLQVADIEDGETSYSVNRHRLMKRGDVVRGGRPSIVGGHIEDRVALAGVTIGEPYNVIPA